MLLLASHFSHVQLSAVPWTIAHRPHCPWDSPGKNTGVACHFLLQGIFWPRDQTHVFWIGRWFLYHWATCEDLSWFMKVKVAQSCLTLHPGQNTGVGSLFLLQGIFPTQGSNPGCPHCRQILYQLSHKGSPRIKEWVAYLFSPGSSQPRNWTRVSCTAGRFFTNWAIREALVYFTP